MAREAKMTDSEILEVARACGFHYKDGPAIWITTEPALICFSRAVQAKTKRDAFLEAARIVKHEAFPSELPRFGVAADKLLDMAEKAKDDPWRGSEEA